MRLSSKMKLNFMRFDFVFQSSARDSFIGLAEKAILDDRSWTLVMYCLVRRKGNSDLVWVRVIGFNL